MIGLREMLGRKPGGVQIPVDWRDVGRWLFDRYTASTSESLRRGRAKRRQDLYDDAGDQYLLDWIDKVFTDRDVRDKRKLWVGRTKFNNVLKRTVQELSTHYSSPAQRHVTSGDENYQAVQRLCNQDLVVRQVERLLNLHRHLLIGFRVRQISEDEREPVIDIVTPDRMFAVSDPLDRTRPIAFGIDQTFDGIGASGADPSVMWWTHHETFKTTSAGVVMAETIREHEFPRMPWMLLSIEPPSGRLMSDSAGEDLVAAHLGVWFLSVLLLKESKSATKQVFLSGDTTQMARNQAADTESPIEAPDGVNTQVIDFSMDLTMFRESADYVFERAAANYGISPAILKHEGATSGHEIELRRIGIMEQRRDRYIPLLNFERWLVETQAMVLARDMPELAFSPAGFSVNFGDVQIPRSETERDQIFETRRRLTLTDTVDEMIRRDPELTVEQALDQMRAHVQVEVLRNQIMRPLAAMGKTEPEPDPQGNIVDLAQSDSSV